MKQFKNMKKESILVGALILGAFTVNAKPLFTSVSSISQNSTLEATCGDKPAVSEVKTSEAKCGEGKCGDKKAEAKVKEGKCGEGKCGEGKCGDKKMKKVKKMKKAKKQTN